MQRKRIDPQARVIHTQVGKTLRKLMSKQNNGKGIGIIRLARQAGIGVGSVQSILNDPDHSPSLRVLDRLSKFFKLRGVHTLVRGMDYEDEVNTWLANNTLPFRVTQDDILRIQKLCVAIQDFDAVSFAISGAKQMNREEFDRFLNQLEKSATEDLF